jgi:cytochrome c553
MTKLSVFFIILIGIIWIKNLSSYKNIEVSNEGFVYTKAQAKYLKKKATLEALEEAKNQSKVKKVVKKKVEFKLDLNSPGLKRGAKLYSKCIVCHAKLGQGRKSQSAPKIGGQHDWYIVNQVKNMRDGVRINKVMDPYIKKLSDQDIKDLGEYISKLPW